MPKGSKTERIRRNTPPISDEARQNRMIDYAMRLVEDRLINGTASSQETTHFLKLGSEREKYEIEKLKTDLRLAEAKIEQLQSSEDLGKKYEAAINAMKSYSGRSVEEDEDYDYY